jgi:hypothetical protein
MLLFSHQTLEKMKYLLHGILKRLTITNGYCIIERKKY